MNLQELTDGLRALGFTTGYVAKDADKDNSAEIILWENDAKQPTYKQIQDAVSLGQYNRELLEVKQSRHNAYSAPSGSDAIFLKYQRGEATKQEWLDAVQAINDAHPYPVAK